MKLLKSAAGRCCVLLLALVLVSHSFASAAFWSQVLSGGTPVSAQGSAPAVKPVSAETFSDVAIDIPLCATDADGDTVIFKIVDAPAYGLAEINGDTLHYTPAGKTGTDKFSYTAIDTSGNTAEPAQIKVKIRKNAAKHTYADMSGNPAHYAALQLSMRGIVTGERIGTAYFFRPNEEVTRSEFITMAAAAAGLPLEDTTQTDFVDDSGLSDWAKPYISAAVASGLISGCPSVNGAVEIRGANPITVAEASVIVSNLLTEQLDEYVMTLATEHQPGDDWATTVAAALEKTEVLPEASKKQAPDSPITRQTACEMLYAALCMLEE